jgi:glyoxylase I family protein
VATTSLHHVGLQVRDVDRAGDFYCAALGGRRLTRPMILEGHAAEQAVETPGARLRMAMIGFGEAAVELFEFLEPELPGWARQRSGGSIPHLAVQVDDVDAVLERIEAAGGRRLWPQVDRFGRGRVIYAADPDGNVIELLDQSAEQVASTLIRWFPDAAPTGGSE